MFKVVLGNPVFGQVRHNLVGPQEVEGRHGSDPSRVF
jgi:hypothetical protein